MLEKVLKSNVMNATRTNDVTRSKREKIYEKNERRKRQTRYYKHSILNYEEELFCLAKNSKFESSF